MMLASFATMSAALALVIWIKLRVVSTIPRQALADPTMKERPAPARSGGELGESSRSDRTP